MPASYEAFCQLDIDMLRIGKLCQIGGTYSIALTIDSVVEHEG